MRERDPRLPTENFENMHARWVENNRLIHFTIFIACLLLTTWSLGFFGFLFCLPLFAWYASRYLINALDEGAHQMRRAKWEPKSGIYHAYDDREVRVFCDPNGACWIAAPDVFKSLQLAIQAKELRHIATRFAPGNFFPDRDGVWWFSEIAALEWVGIRATKMDAEAIRFRRWLEREVFPPMRRKHVLGIATASEHIAVEEIARN